MSSTQIEEFTLKIQRQNAPGETPFWEEFRIPYKRGMNVISALMEIQRNPASLAGPTTPVSYEAACLEEVCGSCTMNINGRVRQACSTLIDDCLEEVGGGTIELRPMTKFKTIRDLIVDRQPMFDALGKVKAWVPLDGTFAMGPGPRMSQAQAEFRYALSRCMTCGCCMESCPQYNDGSDFIGPAPIGQVALFNSHPTGEMNKSQRLNALMSRGGITECGNAQNCVQVCPKEVPLTEAIAVVNRDTVVEGVMSFLRK